MAPASIIGIWGANRGLYVHLPAEGRRMKTLAFLMIVLSLVLAGCGSGGDNAGSTAATQTAAPDSTPAVSPGNTASTFVFASLQDHNYLDPQKITWDHDMRIA